VQNGGRRRLFVADMFRAQSVSDMIVWAAFHPHDYTTVITFGRQHINFWKLFWDQTRGVSAANVVQQTARLLRDKHSGAFDVRTPC